MKTKTMIANIVKTVVFSTLALFVSCGGGVKTKTSDGDSQVTDVESVERQVVEISDSVFALRTADTVAFGKLEKKDVVSRHLTLYNSGDKPFVLVGVDLTCGCIKLDYPRKPLKAGETADMLLTLDTEDQHGFIYKTVLLKTSLNTKEYLLVVTAEIE